MPPPARLAVNRLITYSKLKLSDTASDDNPRHRESHIALCAVLTVTCCFAFAPFSLTHLCSACSVGTIPKIRKDGSELPGTTQPAATAAAYAGNGEDADEGQSHVSYYARTVAMRLGIEPLHLTVSFMHLTVAFITITGIFVAI